MNSETQSASTPEKHFRETSGWRELAIAAGAGRALQVEVTCAEVPGLEHEIRELVEQLRGAIELLSFSSGRRDKEIVCTLRFVPRSAISAGEILIALTELGSVASQPLHSTKG